MPYELTHPDIAAMAPQAWPAGFSASTRPTSTDVGGFIDSVAAEVDARLTSGGFAPLVKATSPLAFAYVKRVISWGALAQALLARGLAAGNPEDQGAGWAMKEFRRLLGAIFDPKDVFELTDAVRTGEAVEKDQADLVTSSVQAVNGGTDDPRMTRAQVF